MNRSDPSAEVSHSVNLQVKALCLPAAAEDDDAEDDAEDNDDDDEDEEVDDEDDDGTKIMKMM